jgi:hypothetical protein
MGVDAIVTWYNGNMIVVRYNDNGQSEEIASAIRTSEQALRYAEKHELEFVEYSHLPLTRIVTLTEHGCIVSVYSAEGICISQNQSANLVYAWSSRARKIAEESNLPFAPVRVEVGDHISAAMTAMLKDSPNLLDSVFKY